MSILSSCFLVSLISLSIQSTCSVSDIASLFFSPARSRAHLPSLALSSCFPFLELTHSGAKYDNNGRARRLVGRSSPFLPARTNPRKPSEVGITPQSHPASSSDDCETTPTLQCFQPARAKSSVSGFIPANGRASRSAFCDPASRCSSTTG